MSTSLELLSKEIGSSINKPLPCNSGEFQEVFARITQQNSSKMTTDAADNSSVIGNGTNGHSGSEISTQKRKAAERKIASCSRLYACKYCCQSDLFVVFSYTMIAVLDSCFRLGHTVLAVAEFRLYKMLHFYLHAYRNQSNAIQRISKGLCAFLAAIVYIEIYIIMGFLKFVLKPMPQWIAIQIHGLLFKIHTKSSQKHRDFDGPNPKENTLWKSAPAREHICTAQHSTAYTNTHSIALHTNSERFLSTILRAPHISFVNQIRNRINISIWLVEKTKKKKRNVQPLIGAKVCMLIINSISCM